jgi:hypothetical protein
MLPHEIWIDELDRQICDPFVIDDPSLGTAPLAHRVKSLRAMRGAGRDRALRRVWREVIGLSTVCPRRFDLDALNRAMAADEIANRDSEITLVGMTIPTRDSETTVTCSIPTMIRDSEPTLSCSMPVRYEARSIMSAGADAA